MRSLTALVAMVTATWVLFMAESYVFFELIRPLAPNIHESATSAVLKLGAVIALFALWGTAMFVFQRAYVRSAVRK